MYETYSRFIRQRTCYQIAVIRASDLSYDSFDEKKKSNVFIHEGD
jgi:hypothetical protein